ncbi:MAG: prepilin-type N-terminal cleavage/methylation domain-containing protein [Bacteroidia bacterium]|nr:prepilin-type N-terminal cleavage/methylation domain-containing protein [Bacteroidia bacterium]
MKLKGFTLIELLITLSLLGVIIVLGNFVFQSLGQYQNSYLKKVDDTYGKLVMYEVIENDAEQAHSFEIPEESLLRFYSKEKDIISSYQSHEYGIIRFHKNQLDSLRVSPVIFQPINSFQFQLIDSSQDVFFFSLKKKARIKRKNLSIQSHEN